MAHGGHASALSDTLPDFYGRLCRIFRRAKAQQPSRSRTLYGELVRVVW